MAERPLSPDEAALWARVLLSVRPIKAAPAPAKTIKPTVVAQKASPPAPRAAAVAAKPIEAGLFEKLLAGGLGSGKGSKTPYGAPRAGTPGIVVRKPPPAPANTLDGSWDKKLARGLISPDRSIDLHGYNLSTAYATLDGALEQSIRAGDRVILLVTGKPPRPTSERPHARGAIRAAIGDWLGGSRHAGAIAAVRGAHPRHGGAGALYIVLRKTSPTRLY